MVPLRALPVLALIAFVLGVIVAAFSHRAPIRGWAAITLLIVAALFWALIDSGDTSRPSSLSLLLSFMIIAPVAVTYSFRARRSAPDRAFALAAFVGAFILGALLVFMLCGIVYALFLI
jgi:VanZ family protein